MRLIPVLLIYMIMTGCLGSQISLNDAALTRTKRIAIIPVESPPFYFNGSQAQKTAYSPYAHLINAPVRSISLAGSLLTIVSGVATVIEAESGGRTPEGVGSLRPLEETTKERWMPTVEFSKIALLSVQKGKDQSAGIVPYFHKLPITDRSVTDEMQNWTVPIKRWYNEDKSTVDFVKAGLSNVDAVVEIGMLSYFYYDSHLFVQVLIKVIDPSNNKVIGRAKHLEWPKVDFQIVTDKDGEEMQNKVIEIGGKGVNECLKDIGLIQE